MSDYPIVPFAPGDSEGVAAHLNTEFDGLGEGLETLDSAVATGFDALHGPGKELGGCGLTVGTGLSCIIGTGFFWVAGRRVEIASAVVVALPALLTSYVYLDADLTPSTYSSLQSPRPEGTWYVGNATTDASSCTAVDDSEADMVSSLTGLTSRVEDLEEWQETAEATLEDHEGRITDLEGGGGGGGIGTIYADPLARAADNAQTVGQKFAALDAEIEELQASGGEGTAVALPQSFDDLEAVNQALELMAQTDADHLEAFESQVNTIQVQWGICGEGSNGTPDYIDRVNSTWLPD